MLRAGLCLDVHVFVPDTASVYTMDQLPEQVQVQLVEYPVMLPAEAGEKRMASGKGRADVLEIPQGYQRNGALLRCLSKEMGS